MSAKLYRVVLTGEFFVVANDKAAAEGFIHTFSIAVNDAMDDAVAVASLVTAKGLTEDERNGQPWVSPDVAGVGERPTTTLGWAEWTDDALAQEDYDREFNDKQLNLFGVKRRP